MSPFSGTLATRPFKVSIPEEALIELKQLIKVAKIGPATFQNTTKPSPDYGVSRAWTENAKEYWLNKYDWRKTEARINSFDNYKATVHGEDGEPIELHFIALCSTKVDAIPIVLLHGWPGSPLEFLDLLDLASAKYKDADLPYTFIVPSLPGYGFSSGPSLKSESGVESIPSVIHQLMLGLGFGGGYISQGGDIGSGIARNMAIKYEACKAVHINFAHMSPPEGISPDSIDAAELQGLERLRAFGDQGDAYAREHGTRPATIGLLLSTSPMALLIWIGEKFLDWVDDPLPLDQILDSVTLYWLTETFPRAIYPYRSFFGPNPELPRPYLTKPLGYSWFPKEIVPSPRVWVATLGNLVWYRRHCKGGHFAALERAGDLLGDIEEFVALVWE